VLYPIFSYVLEEVHFIPIFSRQKVPSSTGPRSRIPFRLRLSESPDCGLAFDSDHKSLVTLLLSSDSFPFLPSSVLVIPITGQHLFTYGSARGSFNYLSPRNDYLVMRFMSRKDEHSWVLMRPLPFNLRGGPNCELREQVFGPQNLALDTIVTPR
jgi:hypothetical protein